MKKTNYVPRLYDFLSRLAANNNRQWFDEHKPLYLELRQLWENDLNRLIAYMAAWDTRLAHLTAKTTAYRIYRDIRFSADKTPFKTYFSAAFSHYGKSTHRACYYLHMDGAGESGLYGGMWAPDSSMLRKVRKAIIDNIDEFESIINAPDLNTAFPQWYGQTLKTVPKGYDRNHPQAEYLRMKDYGRFGPMAPETFFDPSWPEIVAERFHAITPFVEFLNYSLDE